MDRASMYAHVSDETPIDLIAEAWRVLADFDLDPTGRSGRSNVGYFDDDWCKMAVRTIKGFAEAHERPARWPWTQPQFNRFPWRHVPVNEDTMTEYLRGD